MTDQLMLTEELLKEFLDPQLSKFYEFKVESDYPAYYKFQASFFDDTGKQYFLSFLRDNDYGKTSRKVLFSNKKNKNLSIKINIDKGNFIRMLGTIIRIYEAYKETADGKKCTSFAFAFPDSFAKYAPFIVRLVARLWKTEPKKRLSLYGAAESYDSCLVLLYVNVNSISTYFGGPLMKSMEAVDIFMGPFYDNLAGIHQEKSQKADKMVQTSQQKKAVSAFAQMKTAPEVLPEPVTKPMPGINAHPENKNAGANGWVEPDVDDGANYGGIEATHIRMKIDSGSSSLKKGDDAEIYGIYALPHLKDCYTQFGLSKNTIDGFHSYSILIVKPMKNLSKYVAVPMTVVGPDLNQNNAFWYLDADFKDPVQLAKEELAHLEKLKAEKDAQGAIVKPPIKPAVNPDAKQVFNFGVKYQEKLDQILNDIEVGPIKISLDGISILEVSEKLVEISKLFGGLSYDKAKNMAEKISEKVAYSFDTINAEFIKYCRSNDLFAPDDGSPEIKAVKSYTSVSYIDVNKYLRGIPIHGNDESVPIKNINLIDGAFVKYGVKLPRDFKVYRGGSISMEDIEKLNKQGEVPLTGYSSVSTRPTIATDFSTIIDTNAAIAGQVAAVSGDPFSADPTETQNFSSKQGNKILYSIDRLDRCLSLLARDISNFTTEEEIILNRGVSLILKNDKFINRKAFRVIRRAGAEATEDQGIWFARTEISPNSLKESTLRGYLLGEAVQKTSDALDILAIVKFYVDDFLEQE